MKRKPLSPAQINARKRFLLAGMIANIKLLNEGSSFIVTEQLSEAARHVQWAIDQLRKEAS